MQGKQNELELWGDLCSLPNKYKTKGTVMLLIVSVDVYSPSNRYKTVNSIYDISIRSMLPTKRKCIRISRLQKLTVQGDLSNSGPQNLTSSFLF